MNWAVFYSLFESIESTGSLIVLWVLLLTCMIIGWVEGRKITSLRNYLYSPGEMKGWEFGFSETAYMIAVGTTLVLLSSLTVQYGSFFLIVVVISWLLSLFFYGKVVLSGDLIEFFRKKGAHLGEYVVGGKPGGSRSRTETVLMSTISVVVAFTFLGYYFTEILALKILAQGFDPSSNVNLILGGAVILTIIYTTVGGYKGTFKTDVVQTLFLILALVVIITTGMIKTGGVGKLTLKPFLKVGLGESILVLISYSAIGTASLITGLDIWARMRASEGGDARQGKSGLWWSTITLVPFLLVCVFGILFISLGLSSPDQEAFTMIIPKVTSAIGVPIGFLMILLIVVAISTADTSLITFSQAIEPIVGKRLRTLSSFRTIAALVSVGALFVALLVPISRAIQAIFFTISLPVGLTPIVIVRRFSKKLVHPGVAVFAIIGSSVLGLGIGVANPDYAQYSAAVILISACFFYGGGIMIVRMGRTLFGGKG